MVNGNTKHPLEMLIDTKYRESSIRNLNLKYPDILVSFLTDNMDIANRYNGNVNFSVAHSTEKASIPILRSDTKNLSIVPNSFLYSEILIQSSSKQSITFIDDKLEKLSEILDS